MKISNLWNWKIGLVAMSLPLVMAATMQSPPAEDASASTGDSTTAGTSSKTEGELTVVTITNFDALTNAVVATNSQPAAPASIKLYGATSEVVKLAQGGVDETVLLSYVTNSKARFALTSDQIIYLNDLGVSGSVVTAMMQHDAAMAAADSQTAADEQPAVTSLVPETPPTESYYPPGAIPPMQVPASSPMDYPVAGDYYGSYLDTTPVANETGFYDSLLPYGSWLTIAGVGLCWQPTVYVHDHSWRPYGDRGRWIYTDAGWYWQSDYSWGWAAFHYGRWARHHDAGWVWVPDRVWGPAWVSWRNAGAYAGWAPLPPGAVFRPGIGFEFNHRRVRDDFDFGLRDHAFTFVPVAQLSDYNPIRYGVTRTYGTSIFGRSVVVNNRSSGNLGVISPGIDPGAIESFGGSPVRRAVIHDGPRDGRDHRPPMDRMEKQGDTLVVVRPQLPGRTAKPGTGDGKFAPRGGNTVTLPRQNGSPSAPATGTVTTSPRQGGVYLPPRATSTTTTITTTTSPAPNTPSRVHVNSPVSDNAGSGKPDNGSASGNFPSRVHVTPPRGDNSASGTGSSTTTATSGDRRDGSSSKVRVFMTHPEQPKMPIAANGDLLLPPNAPARVNPPSSVTIGGNQRNSGGQPNQDQGVTRPTRLDQVSPRVLTPRGDGGAGLGGGTMTGGGSTITASGGETPARSFGGGRTIGGGGATASSGGNNPGRTSGGGRTVGGGAPDASSGGSSSSRSFLVPSRSVADSGAGAYSAPVTRSAPSQPQGGFLVPSSRSAPASAPPPSAPSGGNSGGNNGGGQSGRNNGGGGGGGGGRNR